MIRCYSLYIYDYKMLWAAYGLVKMGRVVRKGGGGGGDVDAAADGVYWSLQRLIEPSQASTCHNPTSFYVFKYWRKRGV